MTCSRFTANISHWPTPPKGLGKCGQFHCTFPHLLQWCHVRTILVSSDWAISIPAVLGYSSVYSSHFLQPPMYGPKNLIVGPSSWNHLTGFQFFRGDPTVLINGCWVGKPEPSWSPMISGKTKDPPLSSALQLNGSSASAQRWSQLVMRALQVSEATFSPCIRNSSAILRPKTREKYVDETKGEWRYGSAQSLVYMYRPCKNLYMLHIYTLDYI